MKKILLFIVLGFSINALAQGGGFTPESKVPFLNDRITRALDKLEEISDQEMLSGRENHTATVRQALAQRSPVQLCDSICNWEWASSTREWFYVSKYVDLKYNDENNLISITELKKIVTGWEKVRLTTIGYDTFQNRIRETVMVWNEDDSEWENSQQDLYEFDEFNNMVKWTIQNGEGDTWQSIVLIKNEYNAGRKITKQIRQLWDGTVWRDRYQNLYEYNTAGKKVEELQQLWYNNQWANSDLYSTTYDDRGNLTGDVEKIWNGTGWDNEYQTVRTYYSNDSLESVIASSWNVTEWADYSKDSFTYYSDPRQVVYTEQFWNGEEWENDFKSVNLYDNENRQISLVRSTWEEDAWVNDERGMFSYGINNIDVSRLWESWNGDSWVRSAEQADEYDGDDLLNTVYKSFDDFGFYIEYGDSTAYYYHTLYTAVEETPKQSDDVNVYPNPCNGSFTIASDDPIMDVDIFNADGKRIFTSTNNYGYSFMEIDLSSGSPGMYFVNIHQGNKVVIRKIVVQ